jgi:hypothetical protein
MDFYLNSHDSHLHFVPDGREVNPPKLKGGGESAEGTTTINIIPFILNTWR